MLGEKPTGRSAADPAIRPTRLPRNGRWRMGETSLFYYVHRDGDQTGYVGKVGGQY